MTARGAAGRGRMATFTGRLVDPFDLRPDDIAIEDIAHGLSNLCRYSGQACRFYSVGEHSVHVASIALERSGPAAALAGLLHDAHEAYGGDCISPVKHRPELAEFRSMQDRAQLVIEATLGVAWHKPIRELVKKIDTEILDGERHALFPGKGIGKPMSLDFGSMSPAGAEAAFLRAWSNLAEVRS